MFKQHVFWGQPLTKVSASRKLKNGQEMLVCNLNVALWHCAIPSKFGHESIQNLVVVNDNILHKDNTGLRIDLTLEDLT